MVYSIPLTVRMAQLTLANSMQIKPEVWPSNAGVFATPDHEPYIATYANEEKASANTYRRLAISLMVVAAMVLFLPELWHVGQVVSGYSVDWQKALYRLPFSLVLFAPAVYLAKESSRHRINEILNRRRQHILTTIKPYLALLDPKKAEEVKTEVARSLFSDAMGATGEKEDASNMLAQLLNLVATVLKQKR